MPRGVSLAGLALLCLAPAACGPAVLAPPADPLLRQQTERMDRFEAWFDGFRARLRDRSAAVARDCAGEALFVLRNESLWEERDMAPSLVDRERLLQLARWEALRAAAGLPRDLRALSALAELDELAEDREGGAWARCRTAEISARSFDAQAECAEAVGAAGHRKEAVAAWRRAFELGGRDGQRLAVLFALDRLGEAQSFALFAPDVVSRYRAGVRPAWPAGTEPRLEAVVAYFDRELLAGSTSEEGEGGSKLRDPPGGPRPVVRPTDGEP